ncbi:MAG: epoxyqueuosine reductase [Desulfobacteraceae bacterium]|nr:epoxyqueuosine reductase [Desulfobacteraceae bacterium]
MKKNSSDAAQWTKNLIETFIETSTENTLADGSGEKAWTDFLAGFASGADPIFEDYKVHVGEFHWTPEEIFNKTFPQQTARAEELTVISYILPQSPATRKDNRQMTNRPAQRWARVRIYGENFNTELHRHLVSSFMDAGIQAVAPTLTQDWKRTVSPKFGYASYWSQRHAAYAAGLGTFGLCDGLITTAGKAMRAGSVVVRMQIEPTPRPYEHHREYCLFYAKGECGECINRCPVGALSEQGHDKVKCKKFLREVTAPYVKENFGFDGYGCGLCQTGVPCEAGIPG